MPPIRYMIILFVLVSCKSETEHTGDEMQAHLASMNARAATQTKEIMKLRDQQVRKNYHDTALNRKIIRLEIQLDVLNDSIKKIRQDLNVMKR